MKLITRSKMRTVMPRRGEPRWGQWSEWEVCEGTEGLTEAECKRCVREWSTDQEPWLREEYQIRPDNFDVVSYNQALKE